MNDIYYRSTSKQINDNRIVQLLILKLNGHIELSKLILNYRDDSILNEIKKERLEIDFYNWLNHDLKIRNIFDTPLLKNDSNQLLSEQTIHTIDIYYNNNKKQLGLSDEYIRNKSLSECFISKWWLSTEKKFVFWEKIHNIINFKKEIFIYYQIYDHNIDYKDYLLSLNTDLWRKPTFKEKNDLIVKYFEFIELNSYHSSMFDIIETLRSSDVLLFDNLYLIIS